MRGFQPAGAKPQATKSAGPVRGPGTGTSDEVPDTVKKGTYIMPADTTEAIGPDRLAKMGKKPMAKAGEEPGEAAEGETAAQERAEEAGESKGLPDDGELNDQEGTGPGQSIPVQLSNGEFKLSPEQVHAIGVQVLDQMKDATHTPVASRGFAPGAQQDGEPPLFFANGGVVDEENTKRFAQVPASFGNRGNNTFGAASPAAPVAQPARAPAAPTAPASVASPNQTSPTNTFPQSSPSAGANVYGAAGFSPDQFGSSGKFAQVPSSIGQQPGRQVPAPSPVAPAQAAPVQPVQQAPAVAAAPTQPPSAAPSPSNIFPGNRLQGASGFSGAPAVAPPAAAMSDAAATAKLKAVADMNSRGESYGSNAPTMASFGMTPTATASGAASPAAAPVATRTPGASELYMQDRAQEMGDQWRAGNYAQAAGTAGRTAVQGLGMYGLELADKTLTPVGNAIGGFAKGLFGMGDAQAAPAPATVPAASTAVARPGPAPTAPVTPSTPLTTAATAGNGSGTVNPSAPTPATRQPSATEITTGVFRSGNSFSDSAAGAVAGAQPRGLPSAQNMAAADALSQRSQQESGARVAAAQPQEAGIGFSAPSVAHSGNDWAARQRLKDLETSASSITNRAEWRSGSSTPAWGSRQQQGVNDPDGKIGRFNAALQADLAAQGKSPDVQLKTNEINAGLQREGMQQSGENARTALREIGSNRRESNRNAIDQGRLSLEQQVRGFDIRAGQRQEQLQQQYQAAIAKGDTKTAEAITKQVRDLAGKEPTNRFTVVPGGQEWDTTAGAMRNVPGRVLNNQTGQFVDQGGATAAQPSGLPKIGDTRNGYRYKGGNPNDQANWQKV